MSRFGGRGPNPRPPKPFPGPRFPEWTGIPSAVNWDSVGVPLEPLGRGAVVVHSDPVGNGGLRGCRVQRAVHEGAVVPHQHVTLLERLKVDVLVLVRAVELTGRGE